MAKIGNYRMKSLSYLNKYFFKYKWRFLLGVLFIIGQNFFKVKMPDFTGDVIDELVDGVSSENVVSYAINVGLIYVGLSLAAGLFLFLQRQTIIVMSRFIEFD